MELGRFDTCHCEEAIYVGAWNSPSPKEDRVKMGFFCRIYVDKEEIYSGDLTEVPERFRKGIEKVLGDWADSLGRRGLNELVYSLFTWYNEKGMYCEKCDSWNDGEKCSVCGSRLKERFIYARNKKLDLLLTCVGMISRIEVSDYEARS